MGSNGRRVCALIVSALLSMSCGGGGGGDAAAPVVPPTVGAVEVALTNSTLVVGAGTAAVAVARSTAGAILTGRTATWSSSAGAVATVDGSGSVLAVGPGSATISATIEGRTGSAVVTVTRAPVAGVAVSLVTTAITVHASTQATAILRDAAGQVLADRVIEWSSSAPQVASVSASGLVQGLSIGSATITATSEGRTGTVIVTVARAPVAAVAVSLASTSLSVHGTVQATAALRDVAGLPLPDRAIAWSSSAPQIASVSTTGMVQGLAPGTATITATSESRTGSATVTVAPAPVAGVTVSLGSSAINVSGTTQATALLRDVAGQVLSGRPIEWSSSAAQIASVSGAGVIQGLAPGTATITAASEGRTGSATVTIVPRGFAVVALTPTTPLFRGTTRTIDVTVSRTGGFAGSVVVSMEGLPPDVSANTITIPATAETGAIVVTVGDSARLGSVNAVLRARASDLADRTTPIGWTHADAPGFVFVSSRDSIRLTRGATEPAVVTIVRLGGYTGAVTLTAENLPANVSAAPATIPAGANAGVLSVTAQEAATTTGFTLTLKGRGTVGVERATVIPFRVVDPTTFTLSLDSTSTRLTLYGAKRIPVRVRRLGGFRGEIRLDQLGGPISTPSTAAVVLPDSTVGYVELTASNSATAGSYAMQIRGRSAGQPDRTTPLALSLVRPFPTAPDEFLTCPQAIVNNDVFCRYQISRFEQFGLPALSSFRVRNTSILTWDRAQRRQELLSQSAESRAALCEVTGAGDTPLTTVPTTPPRVYNRQPEVQELVRLANLGLTHNGGQWMALASPAAAEYILTTLEQFADAGSLLAFNIAPDDGNSNYDAKRLLGTAIDAYYAVGDAPQLTPARRTKIERYLGELASRLNYNQFDVSNRIEGLDINNHGWFKDHVLMKWGVLTGNDVLFQRGIARYVSVLAGQARADGSIFAEAVRGGIALHYTANAISSLISIAELAAGQGYDLYRISIGGISVHTLVDFYVRAYADESLIRTYAQQRLYCTPQQCASWQLQDRSTVSWSGFNAAAWSEAYLRRFPTSANSMRLLNMYPRSTHQALYFDIWGSLSSCTHRR
jgi:uncharacterized protein YjdB